MEKPRNWFSRNLKWIILGFFVVVSVFILVEACFPGNESSNQSSWIGEILASIINAVSPGAINSSNIDSFNGVVRKLVGHYGLFVVDGLLGFYALKMTLGKWKFYQTALLSSGIGFAVAGISELIQLGVPGRAGAFSDVMIDFAGYMTATLILFLIYFLISTHKRNKARADGN